MGQGETSSVSVSPRLEPVTIEYRNHATDLRGAARLAVEATVGLTTLVEELHTYIAKGPTRIGGPIVGGLVRGITRLVYDSVRTVTRAAGAGIDATLGALAPALGHVQASPRRDALVAVVNGVLGHHLADSGNPLASPMEFRLGGRRLQLNPDSLASALGTPQRRIVVLAHGLCIDDLGWSRGSHDHGAVLAGDLGYSPVYLRYNTGRHISTNGRALAASMEALVGAWPVPVDDVVIVGHSMGGLVARSAEWHARQAAMAWRSRLRKMVFIGTPHHGAPFERGGHHLHVLLGATPYTGPLAGVSRIRSAGITDLRHGYLRDEDWHGYDRFGRRGDRRRPLPLPGDVECYAIAATLGHSRNHPYSRLIGDGLVPVSSALGEHRDARFRLAFRASHRWVAPRTNHFDVLSCLGVYERLRSWLAE